MLTLTGVYTHDMVEKMTTQDELSSALYVVSKYETLEYKNVIDNNGNEQKSTDGFNIVVFPTFEYNKKTDSYNWSYNTKDINNYYCYDNKSKSFSKFVNNVCGEAVKLSLDEKWCSLYKTSTLSSNEEISKYCKN